ncbi:hypothetical protein AcV5_008204 [Taiwanofungus camphoratus]|nr:hypothetical protein AcV5_008204 [Antrodia cinnamomea]
MARLERLGVHPDEKERGSSESGPGKNITAVSFNLAPAAQTGWNFDASRSPRRSKSRILDQKSELQSPEPVPQSRPLSLIWQVPLLLPPALTAPLSPARRLQR